MTALAAPEISLYLQMRPCKLSIFTNFLSSLNIYKLAKYNIYIRIRRLYKVNRLSFSRSVSICDLLHTGDHVICIPHKWYQGPWI